MLICAKCRTVYPTGTPACPRDGEPLHDARSHADAEGDSIIGMVIAKRYRVVERIGVGAMGNVYRAFQAGLDRDVGVKILKREMAWDHETVARFHREAKSMSVLAHPNTVRVFDFGQTDDGQLFLVMELLKGETITQKLNREGRMSVLEAVRTTQQILAALHEAHSHGIIHRDLKPDNIFLAHVEGHADPVVKVLDFGIAKAWQPDKKLDDLETQAGTVFGTPRYMSPEQAQGRELDPRSDVYSVGCLLYQMLAGRALFTDDDAVVVMARHIREAPKPLHEVAPDQPIPARLSAAVSRVLEKNPRARFQNAHDFLEELERAIPEIEAAIKTGAHARAPGFFHRLNESPRAALSIALVLLVSATVAGVLLVRGDNEHKDDNAEHTAPQPNAPSEPSNASPHQALARIESTPPGAEVFHGQDRLGTTPFSMAVASGERLIVEVRLAGYETATTDLVGDDRVRVVQMQTAIVEPPTEDLPSTNATTNATTGHPPVANPGLRSHRRSSNSPEPSARVHNLTATERANSPPTHREPYERFE